MRKILAKNKTLWLKYMIELGAREIDIIRCFVKHGFMVYEPLLLIELLVVNKEVIRDKNNKMHLARKLPPIPKHIVKRFIECMKK